MKRLLILLLLFLCATPAFGAVYHINPATGDNSTGDGSSGSPWHDLDGVLPSKWGSPIAAGDSLKLYAGYHGTVSFNIDAASMTFICGAESDSTDVQVASIICEGSTNWEFRGLSVGVGSAATCFYASDSGGSASRNIYIYNCFIGKTTNYNTWATLAVWNDSTNADGTASGSGGNNYNAFIINYGNNIHIENCLIQAVAYGFMAVGGTQHHIINNIIDGYTQDGYTCGATKGIVIQGNTFKNCVPASPAAHNDGIQFYMIPSADSVYVKNNKILQWDTGGPDVGTAGPQGIVAFDQQVMNGIIENNLVVSSTPHGISFNFGTNLIIRHNTVIDADTTDVDNTPFIRLTTSKVEFGSVASSGIVANNICYDVSFTVDDSILVAANEEVGSGSYLPYVADYDGLDYTAPETSPAINAADTTMSAVFGSYSNATDIVGAARGDARDIGAYEGSAPANVIYHHVNITGATGADGGDGTGANPYEKVATAIAAADDGDIIRVRGTGAEKFTVDAEGVTIKDYPGYDAPIFNGQAAITGFDTVVAGGAQKVSDILFTEKGTVYSSYDATYATARNGAGDSYTSGNLTAGQFHSAPNGYRMRRGLALAAIPDSISGTIDSTHIYLYGLADLSDTDFNIDVIRSTHGPTVEAADYDNFASYAASGAYADSSLNEDWNSKAYSATWNIIKGTAAMKSYVTNYINSTVGFAFLSANDVSNTAPGEGTNEYIQFSSANDATAPYLKVYYTEPGGASDPHILVKAVSGAEAAAVRMWRGATRTLMTKVATIGDLDANDEWFISADTDTIYTHQTTHANKDSLYIDTAGPVATVTAARVTVRNVVFKNYSGFAVKAEGDTAKLYNLAIDNCEKAVWFAGVDDELRNCAIAVTDSIFTETGTNAVYSHNGFDTDFEVPASPAANDVLTSALWADALYTPTDALRDKGYDVGLSYNGTAPEIGPVELDALTVTQEVYIIFKQGVITPLLKNNKLYPIW